MRAASPAAAEDGPFATQRAGVNEPMPQARGWPSQQKQHCSSSCTAHMGAAASAPAYACGRVRAAGTSRSADPASPAVCFISDRAVAGGSAPATAPGRLMSTPPRPVAPVEAAVLAAALQSAFPIMGEALATGAVTILSGGPVVHRAGRVAGVRARLPQREVKHVRCAFVAGRHRPLVALARKSVTVYLPPAELRAAMADPDSAEFQEMVWPCVREAVVCAEVMRRFRSKHGQAALERWFPEPFGWTVEALPEAEAGVNGAYRFVTYSAWQANGNLYSYLNKTFAGRDLEWRTKTIKALTQWTHACELLGKAGITHGDMKPDNLLVDEEGDIKLTDLDGAALLPAHIVADAEEEAEAELAGGAAEGAVRVWRGLETVAVDELPYMATRGFAPPEMWVGWARSHLMSRPDPFEKLQARAEAGCWPGAVQLLQWLDGCVTRVEQLQLLSDLGDRDWMCAASHTYLLGAAVCDWACEQLAKLAGAADDDEAAEDACFLSELHDLAEGVMALQPAQRPSMHQLRTQLARLADDWC